jgi:beta-lactamase class A
MNPAASSYTLTFQSRTDPRLQESLERIDSKLRAHFRMQSDATAVGLLDLSENGGPRLAMIHPDRGEYAASLAKIAILLAYFQLNPQAATNLDARTRHELGLMIKASDNEMATKFSRPLGLKQIQSVLDLYHFYDAKHGGGIWMGKHYGKGDERHGDPLGDNSHAATVRQLLRFYLLLDQGRLVSPEASRTMREIFVSPEIRHDQIKFVEGLAGRNLEILRKWGSWQDWLHDTAIIRGPGRKYILVALVHHAQGDRYLTELASEVDDLLTEHPL